MKAWSWLGRYIQARGTGAFELASTERQLREVWGLTVDSPPGSLLLPVLQAEALKHKFGRVELHGGQNRPDHQQTVNLERKFGSDGWVSLSWYRSAWSVHGRSADPRQGW